MLKLQKITVMTLKDTMLLFPESAISSDGSLSLHSNVRCLNGAELLPQGSVNREHFGKTFLVDSRADNNLIIGEYQVNKFIYKTRMEYVPKSICNIHKEWELKE